MCVYCIVFPPTLSKWIFAWGKGKKNLNNMPFVYEAANMAAFGTSPETTFNSLLET